MRSVFKELLDSERELRSLERELAVKGAVHPDYPGLSARYDRLQTFFESREGYLIDVKIRTVLSGMGFGATDPATPVDVLSGGEKTRLALCKLLLEEPALLILDEPTNHLDFKTLGWLEEYLLGYKGALLAVSHDRYFLDRICTGIWEIERRRLVTYPGNYSRYVALKEERYIRLQKEYDSRRHQIDDLKEFVARNLVRASTTARAQSRRKILEKLEQDGTERPRPPERPPKIRFTCRREPVKDVLHVERLSLSVGEGAERRKLIDGVDFHLMRGDRVALVGANGIGKTTFLRALLGGGGDKPDHGRVEWGVNTEVSYFEQEEFALSSGKSALNELWDRFPQKTEQELRTVMGNMGITGDAVHKRVSALSGGERAKLKFAILTIKAGNVLLMDEPTNHLDLAAREALDAALKAYTGTLLVVSHDRYLLNKFPQWIAEMHEGGIRLYKGGYDDYLAQRAREEAPARAAPQLEGKDETPQKSAYRTKKQRSEQVARRQEIARLEDEIEELEAEILGLESKVSSPEVAADYLLLRETCDNLEEKRGILDEKLSLWSRLAEEEEG
jgi:ATP-binding cassette subfamily F protein 3